MNVGIHTESIKTRKSSTLANRTITEENEY